MIWLISPDFAINIERASEWLSDGSGINTFIWLVNDCVAMDVAAQS
jgi:hypothetical protein